MAFSVFFSFNEITTVFATFMTFLAIFNHNINTSFFIFQTFSKGTKVGRRSVLNLRGFCEECALLQ
jgi:hypothetical protein